MVQEGTKSKLHFTSEEAKVSTPVTSLECADPRSSLQSESLRQGVVGRQEQVTRSSIQGLGAGTGFF
jgi:hypothetical protein